jgi:hypothetical protein
VERSLIVDDGLGELSNPRGRSSETASPLGLQLGFDVGLYLHSGQHGVGLVEQLRHRVVGLER